MHPRFSATPFASLLQPPAPTPPKVPAALALAETLALVDVQQRIVDERRRPLSRAYASLVDDDPISFGDGVSRR